MEISIFLARFWGSLFILLGVMSVGAKFLKRVIEYTDEKTITVATGYITLVLGLATVVAHNIWVGDWRLAVTLLGWGTLVKGIEKVAYPERIRRAARHFKARSEFWGVVMIILGAVYFWLP